MKALRRPAKPQGKVFIDIIIDIMILQNKEVTNQFRVKDGLGQVI